MDFICPNCQKMITVPDQYAGQHMRCPLCQETFQAPALPSSAPPLAGTETYQFSSEPTPPAAPPPPAVPPAPPRVEVPKPKPSVSAPPPPPPPPPAGYGRKFSLQLNPMVLAWVPAGALFLIFILTFF